MKNKLLISIFLSIYWLSSSAIANSFLLESNNIEIEDNGNQINVNGGKIRTNDNNLVISSDKFLYFKKLDLLESVGNGQVFINSEKLKLDYDQATFDQKNLLIKAKGNIKIFSETHKILINTNEITFNQKDNIISSNKYSKLSDDLGNLIFTDSFIYEVKNDLIKLKNIVAQDSQFNTYKTPIAFLKIDSGKIFAKDIKISLSKDANQTENDFRLKGNSVVIENQQSTITKGIFTTCKKRDNCPPWQFSAEQITHDKENKEISYKDALLKVYNIPIFYFPKFFHPDPTVKRKTGFLIPSIVNSKNSGSFLSTPFFYAIADNKDFTFSPRFFSNEKFLLQTEYRHKQFEGDHILDASLFTEKNDKSKSHFFYEFYKKKSQENYDFSEFNLKIQSVSNDIYLKSNKLKSELIKDNNFLENSISFDLYSNDLSVNLNAVIYEDLNKKESDRYEYVLPRIQLSKNFNSFYNLDGEFKIDSDFKINQYDTNITEKININNFTYNSESIINKSGFLNNHQLLIKNTNSENKNSRYKNKKNIYLSSIYQYSSSLPLKKENNFNQNILKPKISLRFAPSHTKNERNITRKVDVNNIFSLDRVTDESSIEGGLSAAYGFDYSKFNKIKNEEIINFKLANNFRIKENKNISNTNQIGEKVSNIFSELLYKPRSNLSFKYISSIKNNLEDINYEQIISEISMNKFFTKFDYLNENNTDLKNSYLSNKSGLFLDNSNSFEFSTRKNITKDLTEYYNLMYQYKNDCLAASIEYSKDFYKDTLLNPEESILFKLTITPFAQIMSPNLKQ